MQYIIQHKTTTARSEACCASAFAGVRLQRCNASQRYHKFEGMDQPWVQHVMQWGALMLQWVQHATVQSGSAVASKAADLHIEHRLKQFDVPWR